jgi:Sugar transport protein
MYVPYRKAYISGMNPLSFVTAFTVGELGTVLALVLALDGGTHSTVFHSTQVRPMLFWLFLGGFVWVVGDLLQQFAVKYLGIGRGIPLSNTNQLWGLAWGALVFGELSHASVTQKLLVLAGSVIMVLGALSISSAVAGQGERSATDDALLRECWAEYSGREFGKQQEKRGWWDYLIIAAAVSIFIWLGRQAAVPPIAMNFYWLAALAMVLVITLGACAWALWKATKFS